jgi:hypothetical protein
VSQPQFKPIPFQFTIDLYQELVKARDLQLQPALNEAVRAVGVTRIDADLQRLVPPSALNQVAGLGLRGERVFPVPSIIAHAPPLIGYYRMLLGISKKEFSQPKRLSYGPWVNAEETGRLSTRLHPLLDSFCAALIEPLTQAVLVMGQFTDRDLSDITLLTLGSTLQGGRNNIIGEEAAANVFKVLTTLFSPWITTQTTKVLLLQLPSGHTAEIKVGRDPDIQMNLRFSLQSTPLIAIEIKGGNDSSNAHNRAGEAEKSQLKAKRNGYNHRWTIIKMEGVARTQIRDHTPSSTAIFEASAILGQTGPDWEAFTQLVQSTLLQQ